MSVLGISNAFPQDQVTLDELLARVETVARDEDGIGHEEQQLAKQLQACGPAVIPRLLPLLEHERKGVRDFIGYVLRDAQGLTEEHLDALIKARKHGNGWIPPAIGRIGTPRAIEFLVHDLELRPQTRTQVTYALKLAGEPAAIALANRFRVTRPKDFDDCACEVFQELGDRASPAVTPLVDAARDPALKIGLRQRAVAALGSCRPGALRSAPCLLALAAADPKDFQDEVEIALTEMHAPECMPFLLQRLESGADMWVLRDLRPLGAVGSDAGPLVLKLLDHADHDLRIDVAETLGCIGYAPAVDELILLSNDADDWRLAAAAIESLVQMRASSAMQVLERVAKNYWSPYVRMSALRAVQRLHAVVGGAQVPFDPASEVDELGPAYEVSDEPMPAVDGGPDALSANDLERLSYTVEIESLDARVSTSRRGHSILAAG